MPVYEIRGIPVQFPYQAYPPQLKYMETVIDALIKGENALLESPTGTGKTLCLLCATLAYHSLITAKTQLAELAIGNNSSYQVYLNQQKMQPTHMAENNEKLHDRLALISKKVDKVTKVPLIIYASRTHSQLKQVAAELEKTSYRPKIAMVSSREQLCVNPSVRGLKSNASMTAMCGQLVKRNTCVEYTKVGEAVTRLESERKDEKDKIFDIEDILRISKRHNSCPFYLTKNDLPNAEVVFMPYNYLVDRKTQGTIASLDLQGAIVIFDEAHNIESFCGEARSTDISTNDLTSCIGEINHVRQMLHRINFAEPITCSTLDNCQESVVLLLETIKSLPMNKDGQLLRDGRYILDVLSMAKITDVCIKGIVQTFEAVARAYVEALYQKRQQQPQQHVTSSLQGLASAMRTIFGKLDDDNDNEDDNRERIGKVETNKEKRESQTIQMMDRKFFRVYVKDADMNNGNGNNNIPPTRTLSYWCFNPGVAMRELLAKGLHSLILTSGTLSPLLSFKAELGIAFPHQLENDHVIGSDQIFCSAMGIGPRGGALNSSFTQRDSVDYKSELGLAILETCRLVPDGVLVFFPSYPLMEAAIDCWKATRVTNSLAEKSIYEKISTVKAPFTEPKNKNDLTSIMDAYNRAIGSGRGAIFFAVCRGKVSEGLDFSDSKCRAVIITGIPYPPLKDPRVMLKRQYLDDRLCADHDDAGDDEYNKSHVKKANETLTGNQWYDQQASRAVNQAIGRVIRHKDDYGAVLLFDDRFTQTRTNTQLSKWLRGLVRSHGNFNEMHVLLANFFASRIGSSRGQQVEINNIMNPQMPSKSFLSFDESSKKVGDAVSFFIEPHMGFKKASINMTRKEIPLTDNDVAITPSSLAATTFITAAAAFKKKTTETSNKSVQVKEQAQKFLLTVQSKLRPSNQKLFTNALREYRAEQINVNELIERALKAFTTDEETRELHFGFRNFISAKHHDTYDRICIEKGLVQKEINDSPSIPVKRSAEESRNDGDKTYLTMTTTVNTLADPLPAITSSASTTIAACPICLSHLKNPYRAKCGHVGCFTCWNGWLQKRLECPICKARTRIPQLKKIVL